MNDFDKQLEGLSTEQVECCRAYAVRQYEVSRTLAAIHTATGTEKSLGYARNHAHNMHDMNDFIDACNRILGSAL
jgi:hypothetical protein